MEGPKTESPTIPQNGAAKHGRGERRRHMETNIGVRFFLPKPGTNLERPELGREVPSEGEALIEAFRKGMPVYTLIAWEAVAEMDGGEPKIVKQVLTATAPTSGTLKAS